MLKKLFFNKEYHQASDGEKKMMWLNFFTLLFIYGGLRIIVENKR